MATLTKNELTLTVKNGIVTGTRIISDEQPYDTFIKLVNDTEVTLKFMKESVANFEETVLVQKNAMRADYIKRRKLKDFEKAWEQHHLGLLSQKKMWEEKDIPNVEAEIDKLIDARNKAVLDTKK